MNTINMLPDLGIKDHAKTVKLLKHNQIMIMRMDD
jgi:hypothetical protein